MNLRIRGYIRSSRWSVLAVVGLVACLAGVFHLEATSALAAEKQSVGNESRAGKSLPPASSPFFDAIGQIGVHPGLGGTERGTLPREIPSEFDLRKWIIENNLPHRVFLGDDNSNTIGGTPGPDVIFTFGGADRLSGGLQSDILVAGPGNDFLVGNNGSDIMLGETGNDYIDASNGIDTIFGGTGNDTILALSGDDIVDAGSGDDDVNAGLGNDVVFGGAGDDILWGRWGADLLKGGPGNDRLQGASDNNTLHGGAGADIFYYDLYDSRDNDAVDTIMDFEKGVDRIRVNVERIGTVQRIDDGNEKRTLIHISDPSGNNVRDIIVRFVWINANDVETY